MSSLIKTSVAFDPGAHAFKWDQTGPKCLTCIKMDPVSRIFKPSVVTAWELVENMPGSGKKFAKMLVKCHGQEQLVTFDMGTEHWSLDEVAKRFQEHRWFDPHSMDAHR